MRRSVRDFLVDQRGATALEYSLIAIFVSIMIIGGARTIGGNLSTLYFGKLVGNF